jgi:hypothetical protein
MMTTRAIPHRCFVCGDAHPVFLSPLIADCDDLRYANLLMIDARLVAKWRGGLSVWLCCQCHADVAIRICRQILSARVTHVVDHGRRVPPMRPVTLKLLAGGKAQPARQRKARLAGPTTPARAKRGRK